MNVCTKPQNHWHFLRFTFQTLNAPEHQQLPSTFVMPLCASPPIQTNASDPRLFASICTDGSGSKTETRQGRSGWQPRRPLQASTSSPTTRSNGRLRGRRCRLQSVFVSPMSSDIFMGSASVFRYICIWHYETGINRSDSGEWNKAVSSCQFYTFVQFPAVWFVLTEQIDCLIQVNNLKGWTNKNTGAPLKGHTQDN